MKVKFREYRSFRSFKNLKCVHTLTPCQSYFVPLNGSVMWYFLVSISRTCHHSCRRSDVFRDARFDFSQI